MLYFVIGLFAGIISGMGIGGGTVLIPALVLFSPLSQQQAQGINLVVFLPAAISALIIHHKNKNLEYKMTLPIVLTGIVGAVGGSILAVYVSPDFLKRLFGIFLFIVGLLELFSKGKSKH